MNTNSRKLCIKALFIALVCVATMFLQIPVAATNGYIHLGDSIILISGVFFGWQYGMLAGGIGSALADLLTGYPHWMFFTFFIKAFMGFLAGKLSHFEGEKDSIFSMRNILTAVIVEIWMVIGYLFAGTILNSSFAVSLSSVPSNLVQGAGGLIIYFVAGYAFEKAKICKYCRIS